MPLGAMQSSELARDLLLAHRVLHDALTGLPNRMLFLRSNVALPFCYLLAPERRIALARALRLAAAGCLAAPVRKLLRQQPAPAVEEMLVLRSGPLPLTHRELDTSLISRIEAANRKAPKSRGAGLHRRRDANPAGEA